MKRIAIDLFAGAGGLSTGIVNAGFNVVFANEILNDYAETFKKNHHNTKVSVEDITKLSPSEIRKVLGIRKTELDLLAGGPPCQGFSINAPERTTKDARNHLFLDFIRFAKEFRPKTLLIENVPGIISFDSGNTFRSIVEVLTDIGYRTEAKVLFAPHYGIPQIRWRTIIIATILMIDPIRMFPNPTHLAKGRANFRTHVDNYELKIPHEYISQITTTQCPTVWDAISDLPEIENGEKYDRERNYEKSPVNTYQLMLRGHSTHIDNHTCSTLSEINLQRFNHVPEGGSWRDIPYDLLPLGMKRARRSDHTKRYGRLAKTGLASTILTKCDPHWGTYVHPTQNRIISVREAARLQSFPDYISFTGSVTRQYEQVGNAVPPLLSEKIATQIYHCLDMVESAGEVTQGYLSFPSQGMLAI